MGPRQVQEAEAVVWLLGAAEGSSRSAEVGAWASLTAAAVARRPVVEVGAEEHPPVEVVLVAVAVAEEVAVAVEEEEVVVEERGSRAAEAVRVPRNRRSSLVESVHSGTLPCLRRGSSSRLVANIRSPATSFWRVSAGSITSSM